MKWIPRGLCMIFFSFDNLVIGEQKFNRHGMIETTK